MAIESRIPFSEYTKLPGLSISRLKELKRSPQHYRHRLENPLESDALVLGTASHTATLEPERFASQFAVWSRRTDAGKMAPRSGQWWERFCSDNAGKSFITEDEASTALTISAAVRANPIAAPYLESGDPEVTLTGLMHGRDCRGRIDWLTHRLDRVYLVGLKTARDCRVYQFGAQSAKLGYALQWSWYHDLYRELTGKEPRMLEIVVESAPPHAVAVYRIPSDIIEQGRAEYLDCLRILADCEESGEWPGPVPQEEELTLPSWAYEAQGDDVAELGLVA